MYSTATNTCGQLTNEFSEQKSRLRLTQSVLAVCSLFKVYEHAVDASLDVTWNETLCHYSPESHHSAPEEYPRIWIYDGKGKVCTELLSSPLVPEVLLHARKRRMQKKCMSTILESF